MASETAENSAMESGSSQQQSNSGGRSKLVQRLLMSAGNLPQFLNDLLNTMAVVVAGTEAAAFVIEPTAPSQDPQAEGVEADAAKMGMILRPVAHLRPDDSNAEIRQAALLAFQEIVLPCVQQGKDGAVEVGTPDTGEPQYCLVTLLRSEQNIVAVTAVITRARDIERARQRLTSMQLVAGYFEMFQLRRNAIEARSVAQNHQNVLQLATAVSNAEGFDAAAMNLCNELASRTGASRVALGWVKNKRNVKLKALSHTEKFDKKQELIVQLEKAMEECFDQEEPVKFEFDGQRSENVTRMAENLSRAQGGNSVITLPLRRKDEIYGVLLLEFAPPAKLPDSVVDALIVAVDILTPQLMDRHDNDRWLVVKAGHSIKHVAGLTVGPKHMLAKLVISLLIVALLAVVFFKPMYHVNAPFTLAAIGKIPISIPNDGILFTIEKNPETNKTYMAGDSVKAGAVLARMKTDELEKRMLSALSKKAEAHATAESWRTRTKNDPSALAQWQRYTAEEKSAQAEIDLLKLQMDQAELKSPVDAVIIKADDLDSKPGSSVKRGDVLMELARDSKLRVELSVNEKDHNELIMGQIGTITALSKTDQEFKIKIMRIVPQGEAMEQDNFFRVYAVFDEPQGKWMTPGMKGEAKIEIEKRRLGWIWTHRLVDFVKMKLWQL